MDKWPICESFLCTTTSLLAQYTSAGTVYRYTGLYKFLGIDTQTVVQQPISYRIGFAITL